MAESFNWRSPLDFNNQNNYGTSAPLNMGGTNTNSFGFNPGGAGGQETGSWWNKWMGDKENTGFIPGALSAGQGILGGFLGLQQLNMGKRQYRDAQQNHQTNLSNQARTTNMSIHDLHQSRYGGNAGNQALLNWGVSGKSGQTGYSGAQTGGGQPTGQSPNAPYNPESPTKQAKKFEPLNRRSL